MGWIKLALLFHTVSAVNAQTCLNCYNRVTAEWYRKGGLVYGKFKTENCKTGKNGGRCCWGNEPD